MFAVLTYYRVHTVGTRQEEGKLKPALFKWVVSMMPISLTLILFAN